MIVAWTLSVALGSVALGVAWTPQDGDPLQVAEDSLSKSDIKTGLAALGQAYLTAPSDPRFHELLRALPESDKGHRLLDDQGRDVRYFPEDGSVRVFIPAGVAPIGTDDADSLPEERPQRSIKFPQGFWIDAFEVSNRRYRRFVQETGHPPPPNWVGREPPRGTLDHPVTWIRWTDAVAFAKHLKGRLPTELEWEYSARAADPAWLYPWGNEPPKNQFGATNWDLRGRLEACGSFPRGISRWGCHDMAGNVWEWCLDSFIPFRYQSLPPDAVATPVMTESSVRCRRGGSWWDAPEFSRVTYRSFFETNRASATIGFRLVRDGRRD